MLAEKVGSETLLAQIIEMVNSANRSKAPIQKRAYKISEYFVDFTEKYILARIVALNSSSAITLIQSDLNGLQSQIFEPQSNG